MNTLERVKPKATSDETAQKQSPPAFIAPLLLTFFIIGAVCLYLWGLFEAQQIELPTLKESAQGIRLYDRNNKFLCTVQHDRDCEPVPLAKISEHVRNGVVSSEDRHFYSHHGIDIGGIARAAIANHKAGHIVQGASTITQQLVRNLFLDKNDRSYERKLKEVAMSVYVDTHYSKSKILEGYLNEVYFGDGVHGIERAAQHFFNKHASKLSLNESTFLVGLIRQPSQMAQAANRKLALARRDKILRDMQVCGYISEDELRNGRSSTLAFKTGPDKLRYPYYVSYVLEAARKELGDKLWTQEWNVYTNLDQKAQQTAEKVLNNSIKKAPKGIDQAALVTMSLKDGAVLAIVGGVGDKTRWNRALAPHTAGSIFKPFVYLAALIQGTIEADSVINDAPLSVGADKYTKAWEPKNFDGSFHGWTTARNALVFSRNVCAARVALETGMNEVISVARAAGIDAQLDPFPALALGSCAVTPLNMTTAYATLARGGVYMQPQVLRSIKDEHGGNFKTIYSVERRELDPEKVSQLVDVLQDVVRYGTGTRASLAGVTVAGKTGTADKGKDIWFVGFTPDTVTTVWAGNDLNKPVDNKNVTGGKVMAGIWQQVMTAFYTSHKPPKGQTFPRPAHALIAGAPAFAEMQNFSMSPDPKANEQVIESKFANLADYSAEYTRLAKRIFSSGIAKVGDLNTLNTALISTRIQEEQKYNDSNATTDGDEEASLTVGTTDTSGTPGASAASGASGAEGAGVTRLTTAGGPLGTSIIWQ